MRTSTLVITVLGLVVGSLMTANTSLAKGSKQAKFRARLTPCCTVESEAEGKLQSRTRSRNEGEMRWSEFKGKVEVPIPSEGLGIVDEASAMMADVRLVLHRDELPYAECFLTVDGLEMEDEDEEETTKAVYKVHVRLWMRKGFPILRAVKGACDLALEIEGLDAGVPDVQDGDGVMATVVVDPDDRSQDLDFLEGMFRKR